MRRFLKWVAIANIIYNLIMALYYAFTDLAPKSPELLALSTGLAWLAVLFLCKALDTQHVLIERMRLRLAQLGVVVVMAATLAACGTPQPRVYHDFACRDANGRITLFIPASDATMQIAPDGRQDWTLGTHNWPLSFVTKPGERCDFETAP